MRFNGRPILLASFLPSSQVTPIPPYRCHIHRSICHHARRAPVRPRVSSAVPPAELRRTAKTKSTVQLKDLPQGVMKLEAYDEGQDDAPRYPTVVQGHRNNMQKFKNCVILTRVGGFYEVRTINALYQLDLANNIFSALLRTGRGARAIAQFEACEQKDQRWPSADGWLPLLPARSIP